MFFRFSQETASEVESETEHTRKQEPNHSSSDVVSSAEHIKAKCDLQKVGQENIASSEASKTHRKRAFGKQSESLLYFTLGKTKGKRIRFTQRANRWQHSLWPSPKIDAAVWTLSVSGVTSHVIRFVCKLVQKGAVDFPQTQVVSIATGWNVQVCQRAHFKVLWLMWTP